MVCAPFCVPYALPLIFTFHSFSPNVNEELLNVSRSTRVLRHLIPVSTPTHRARALLISLARDRDIRHRPSIHTHMGHHSKRRTTRTPTLFRHRQHTICTGRSARSLLVCWLINALLTISSFQIPSAKSCRRRPRLHVKFCQIRRSHRLSSFTHCSAWTRRRRRTTCHLATPAGYTRPYLAKTAKPTRFAASKIFV
jgi:hypothetical protein